MKKLWLLAMLIAPLAFAAPQVVMQTNHGDIVVELAPTKAPQTVKNFLRYVADGSYNGTIFHRVINQFVVQGGGYNQQYQQLDSYGSVVNESRGGLANDRGTIAMARTQDPDSATRQFYFNLSDNNQLNANGGPGYTVFGKVIAGMDVLDKLAEANTTYNPVLRANDVPVSALILKKVTLVTDTPAATLAAK
ncbi:MAG: peptidylprolyl isomerase [Plesiomonas shigelloides]